MNKKNKFLKLFVEHQYELVGSDKSFDYAVNNAGWVDEYFLTEQQKVELWIWGFKLWRKRFKTGHNETVKEFSDFYDAYSFSQRSNSGDEQGV